MVKHTQCLRTLEALEQWRLSGAFIVNFEHISHLVLVFLLLTLSNFNLLSPNSINMILKKRELGLELFEGQ